MSRVHGAGILCPECDGPCDEVVDTRKRASHIYRRRRCIWCTELVTTREVIVGETPNAEEFTLRAWVEWPRSGSPRLRIEQAEEPTP